MDNQESKNQIDLRRLEDNFLRVLAGSVGVAAISFFSTWILFVRNEPSESKDKLLALVTGLAVLTFGLLSLGKKFKFPGLTYISSLGVISVFSGILIVEHKEMAKEHPMGFGVYSFLIAILITPFLPKIVKGFIEKKMVRILLVPLAVFILSSVLLAFIQWNGTLVESAHSEYVINEILARGAGYIPFQDFIPQYSYLLSWVFAPAVRFLNADQAVQLIVLVLSAGSILCLGLVLWLGKKAFPKLPVVFLVIAMIPFTTPTPGWNRATFSGPISTLLSGPSIRVLGGFLVGVTLYIYICGFTRNTKGTRFGVFAGAVGSLVAWNNFDFGVASLVTALFVLLVFIGSANTKYWKYFYAYLMGVLGSSMILFLTLGLIGGAPKIEFLAWFSRQFGGGFGSVTISVPGPVLVNFPLIFGVATLGTYALIMVARKIQSYKSTDSKLDAALITAFFGVWSVLCLPYYLNRSYQAGQMSIEYIGLAVALIGAISLVFNSWVKPGKEFLGAKLLTSSLLAFSISTIVVIPNITMEWDRLHGANTNGRIPRPLLAGVISNMDEVKNFARQKGLTLGYYGEIGNYIEKKYEVPSVNIFNNPADMFQSNDSVQVSCAHLTQKNYPLLMVSEIGKMTFAWKDGSLCDGLYRVIKSGSGVYLAQRDR